MRRPTAPSRRSPPGCAGSVCRPTPWWRCSLPNTVESVIALLGVLRAGMIAAPLPLLWRQQDMVAALVAHRRQGDRHVSRIGADAPAEIAMQVAAELFPIRARLRLRARSAGRRGAARRCVRVRRRRICSSRRCAPACRRPCRRHHLRRHRRRHRSRRAQPQRADRRRARRVPGRRHRAGCNDPVDDPARLVRRHRAHAGAVAARRRHAGAASRLRSGVRRSARATIRPWCCPARRWRRLPTPAARSPSRHSRAVARARAARRRRAVAARRGAGGHREFRRNRIAGGRRGRRLPAPIPLASSPPRGVPEHRSANSAAAGTLALRGPMVPAQTDFRPASRGRATPDGYRDTGFACRSSATGTLRSPRLPASRRRSATIASASTRSMPRWRPPIRPPSSRAARRLARPAPRRQRAQAGDSPPNCRRAASMR